MHYIYFNNFTDKSILLTIKSSTTEVPYSFKESTDAIINDLVLPAPPLQDKITEDSVKQLIIPDPECEKLYVLFRFPLQYVV